MGGTIRQLPEECEEVQVNGLAVARLTRSLDYYYEKKCASLDREIDNLVYELYALTKDEIRIVEEAHE